ncbi:MAG: hypothetical protein V3V25_08360 [Paracoccaceae bacterium]
MPLDKFATLLICVIAAAGLTIWLGASAVNRFSGAGIWGFVPVILIGFVVLRVLIFRLK